MISIFCLSGTTVYFPSRPRKWGGMVPEWVKEGVNTISIKILIFVIALFSIMGLSLYAANGAAGPASGCGYTSYIESCQGGEGERQKCKAELGGEASSCDLTDCSGTTITTLTGPLTGC